MLNVARMRMLRACHADIACITVRMLRVAWPGLYETPLFKDGDFCHQGRDTEIAPNI
jgi:hypothetical protein